MNTARPFSAFDNTACHRYVALARDYRVGATGTHYAECLADAQRRRGADTQQYAGLPADGLPADGLQCYLASEAAYQYAKRRGRAADPARMVFKHGTVRLAD
jgi:hypothetical protein